MMQALNVSYQGTLFFMAAKVLTSYVAHDVSHDLESAIWLLVCMALRHTLQVVRGQTSVEWARYQWYCELFGATDEMTSAYRKSYFMTHSMQWEVKGNQPLTDLIRNLKILVLQQNRDPEMGAGDPVPLTYKSVLTEINRALALPGWPKDDAALPFTLPRDGSGSSSTSKDRKHPREEDGVGSPGDHAEGSDHRAAKRPQLGPSPLRNEVDTDRSE